MRDDDRSGSGKTFLESEAAPVALWRRALQAVTSLGVVLLIFIGVFPKLADFHDVWAAIDSMSWAEVALLLLAAALPIVAYWFVLTSVLPSLRLPEAGVAHQSSTAVANTIPGGGAVALGVSYAMYQSWGFTLIAISSGLLLAGIGDQAVKLGLPVFVSLGAAVSGDLRPGLITAVAIGSAILVGAAVVIGLALNSETFARRVGELLTRMVNWFLRRFKHAPVDLAEGAVKFRLDTVNLLRFRGVRLLVALLVSHLSLYLVLLMSLRFVGVSEGDVSWFHALVAFSFVRLITAIPITPGGLGVAEVSYVFFLSSQGQPDELTDLITAGVLVFRALTFLPPIFIGLGCWVFWRVNRSWRQEPNTRPPGYASTAAAAV